MFGKKKLNKEQRKTIENLMDIFEILVDGGYIDVQIYKDRPPAYFVNQGSQTYYSLCTEKIYKGLLSRGLLVLKEECVLKDFVVQTYILRIPKKNKE